MYVITTLWDFIRLRKRYVCLNWELQRKGAKDSSMRLMHLNRQGWHDKNIFFLSMQMTCYTHASFANIPNVRMLSFDQWNAYDLVQWR